MSTKILINAVDSEECRIAIVKDNHLEEFHVETAAREITKGNIYKGVISRIEPSLQAVFVDYGAERHGFLQKHEIHSDYFQDTPQGEKGIDKILKPRQELLVQVTKDPMMKKGAMLTTLISLAGRCVVLMPGSTGIGVSRKIEEEKERARLKEIAENLGLPEGFGLIIRTVAKGQTKTLISKDVRSLVRLWKTIMKKGVTAKSPALLHQESSLVIRSIRDYFNAEVSGILVDDEAVYEEVVEFVRVISPRRVKIVKLHKEPKPIFTKYQLEEQIASVFESRVGLKSGGTIVIHPTEALVSIDVNSGRSTKESNVEKTAFQTNLEAAEEAARQLRIRDLGGLIVVDFIDMKDPKHRAAIEKAMREHTKADKARIKVGRISSFGLMEMSRQRIRPSIEYGSYIECSHCRGKGMVPSVETLALGFLRKLRMETAKDGLDKVEATVPPDVADYILNKKRNDLVDLETRREVSIVVRGDASLLPGDSRFHSEMKA